MTVARLRALTKKPTRLKAIADNLLGEVVSAMNVRLDEAVDILRVEPPPKAGSRYIRTHTYSTGWKQGPVTFSGSGLRGTIFNDARYAVFVGGNEAGLDQQIQHRITGWTLMAVALRDGKHGISFNTEIKRILRKSIDNA